MTLSSPDNYPDAHAHEHWLDLFFDLFYARRMVDDTFIGMHPRDAYLPDYSDGTLREVCRDMQALLDALDRVPHLSTAVAPQARGQALESPHDMTVVDVRLARDYLDIQLEEFGLGWLHRRNPTLYTGEAIFGVIGLFLGDFELFESRVQNAIARLRATPRFLAQGKANLQQVPRAWVEKAIKECAGATHFLTTGLDDIIRSGRAAARDTSTDAVRSTPLGRQSASLWSELRAAADFALDAFRDFECFLRDDLLGHSDDSYACGAAFFNLLMHKGHHFDQDGEAIMAYGTKRLRELQSQRTADAAMFHRDGDWREVLALTTEDHPTLEHYPRVLEDEWRKCKALCDEHALVTWPSDWALRYTPMPTPFRMAAPYLYFLPYRSPAPFDTTHVYDYWVPYIDPEASDADRMAKLRAMNMSVVKLNYVAHHGAIGHHVQNWYASRAESSIGQIAATDCALRIALFCGGSMAEGWACYATDLMDEVGYYTPLERFAHVHTQVRQAARCVVDAALHLGAMTFDEAVAFYIREAGMTADAAHAEVVKNSMFPGAAVMYLLGTDHIHALRRELQARQGSAFNLRAFHDSFLGYGSLPVPVIANLMLNTTQEGV